MIITLGNNYVNAMQRNKSTALVAYKQPNSNVPKSARRKRAKRGPKNQQLVISKPVSTPVAKTYQISGNARSNTTRLEASLTVAEVSVSSVQAANSIYCPITFVNLNPFLLCLGLGGTLSGVGGATDGRIAHMAACFTEYRMKRVKVVYVPTCSSATTGSVVLSYFENPAAMLAAGATAIGGGNGVNTQGAFYSLCTYQPFKEGSVHELLNFDAPVNKSWKQCDPFEAMGIYPTIASSGGISVALHDIASGSNTYGSIKLTVEIEFRTPTYTPSFASVSYTYPLVNFKTIATTAALPVLLQLAENTASSGAIVSDMSGGFGFIPNFSLTIAGVNFPAGDMIVLIPTTMPDTEQAGIFYLYWTLADAINATPILTESSETSDVDWQGYLMSLTPIVT